MATLVSCSALTKRCFAWSAAAALCAIYLQGCDVVVPRHVIGNWEMKENYLTKYQYTPPASKQTYLNSCMTPDTPKAMQCSGHGICRDWNDPLRTSTGDVKPLAFCECDKEWADPECTTPRKSQLTAFLFSALLGYTGADQLYLGFPWWALLKLVTFGGCGLWYFFDIIRIGSTTVSTQYNFQVADDLPHFIFVLAVILYVMLVGFALGIYSIQKERIKKAHEVMLLRSLEDTDVSEIGESKEFDEFEAKEKAKVEASGRSLMASQPVFRGYGSTVPATDMVL